MKGFQVAAALSRLAAQRPEFDGPLNECLAKFLKSTLFKTPSLELLQSLPKAAGSEFADWVVTELPPSDLDKLLKKVDPHGSKALGTAAAKTAHAVALMEGKAEPTPKTSNGGRGAAASAMATGDILALRDREQRRSELEKLSAAQLKTAIKKHELFGASLSKKPSKTELVEHILAVIDAGWPRPTSILEGSRY